MKKKDNKNPFKTPEGYFDSFQDKLLERLSDEAPSHLDSINGKDDGFRVPNSYFDGLNDRIKERLHDDVKVIPLRPYRNYYLAAASIAAVTLLLFGIFWNSSEEISFTDLANSDIEAYFENNDFELSSYEIAEEIPVDGLELRDFLDTQFNDEHIVNYIDENTDNFDELNLEDDE
ncbi:hypothetical protein [Maribacter aestuarii]|uniref:hypothetical protein n=1 Tax=Maribacter aestuarii TaxID=1130723 RepID=UPI00248B63FB|nr:hypothetical protein [Maribacter aestuarii]